MKTALFILFMFISSAGCKKPCYECKWERNYGHSTNKYTVKQETFCNEDDVKAHDGKSEYVLTEDGWKMAVCTCEQE